MIYNGQKIANNNLNWFKEMKVGAFVRMSLTRLFNELLVGNEIISCTTHS